jgi:hypothetical protein
LCFMAFSYRHKKASVIEGWSLRLNCKLQVELLFVPRIIDLKRRVVSYVILTARVKRLEVSYMILTARVVVEVDF